MGYLTADALSSRDRSRILNVIGARKRGECGGVFGRLVEAYAASAVGASLLEDTAFPRRCADIPHQSIPSVSTAAHTRWRASQGIRRVGEAPARTEPLHALR
jgi:hypothetical protein